MARSAAGSQRLPPLPPSAVYLYPMPRKPYLFWSIFVVWLVLDFVTKRWALAALWPPGVPHDVLGEYLRWTLAFNRGAAMGMHLGEWSRVVFTVIGGLMLAVLYYLYRQTDAKDWLRTAILAFVMSGALGNLIDRVRFGQVTDFIDVGLGSVRFWTFNVADMGITCGAIALALILGKEERHS
jgi:signal peptidase II